MSSGPLLILTRFVKGLAAAFTAPTGLSLITTNFTEGPARNKALSIYTVFGAGGYSSGLLFGGLMTGVGWRWTFLLPVPIALAALVAAFVLLPRESRPGRAVTTCSARHSPRPPCCCSSTPSSRRPRSAGAQPAPSAPSSWPEAVRDLRPRGEPGQTPSDPPRHPAPGLAGPCKPRHRRRGRLLLQLAVHRDLVPAGLAGLEPAASCARAAADRHHGRGIRGVLRQAGRPVRHHQNHRRHHDLDGGGLPALPPDRHESVVPDELLPALLLIGVGWIGFPAINIQATNGISDDEQGLAAGVLQTSMQVGAAVVLAITTALIAADGTGPASAEDALGAYRHGLVFGAVVSLVGAAVAASALIRRRGTRSAEPLEHALPPEPEYASTGG